MLVRNLSNCEEFLETAYWDLLESTIVMPVRNLSNYDKFSETAYWDLLENTIVIMLVKDLSIFEVFSET